MLRGEGVLVSDEGEVPLMPDQAILIPPNEEHQFRCTGPDNLEMLCIVRPLRKSSMITSRRFRPSNGVKRLRISVSD